MFKETNQISKGDLCWDKLEILMNTEKYKMVINAYAILVSSVLDGKFYFSELGKYLECKFVIYLFPIHQDRTYIKPSKFFKILEEYAKKSKIDIQLLDDFIINRTAEINLIKSLRKLGDQIGTMKTDFIITNEFFTLTHSLINSFYNSSEIEEKFDEEIPYEIDFEIAIGEEKFKYIGNKKVLDKNAIKEDENRKKEELRKKFIKDIKPLFITYINKKIKDYPNINEDEEVYMFSLKLGLALKNEMIFGKNLDVFNNDEMLIYYLNELCVRELCNFLYKDILGTPADTIIIAMQCINILSERYNKEENFKGLKYIDNNKKDSDIKSHIEKLNNLYVTLSVLRNIILKKYGDYSIYDNRNEICYQRLAIIKFFIENDRDYYYSEVNKRYKKNVGDSDREIDSETENQNQNDIQNNKKNTIFDKFKSEDFQHIKNVNNFNEFTEILEKN